MSEALPLLALTFLIAFVYSSVGHGGASGYLALLSFYSFSHEAMASSALCLNLLVAGTAFWAYWRARHFSRGLIGPFLVVSVPAAFLGGALRVSPILYSVLLSGVLVYASVRLFVDGPAGNGPAVRGRPSLPVSLSLGGLIGLVSGIVGVGGGIFLSPILLLCGWADAKKTAAASAFFILVNSAAGLLGRAVRGGFAADLSPILFGMVGVAAVGGVIGSRLGARSFPGGLLRKILSLVLLAAVMKLVRGLF